MRKVISKTTIVLFAAALLMVGCKNEADQTFKLEIPQYTGGDKTTFGTGNTTQWSAGDGVLINAISGTVRNQSGTAVVDIDPVTPVNNMYYSLYAGRATSPSFNGENGYSFTMPTSFTYNANQLQAPMAGQCEYIDGEHVHTIVYSNIFTLLRLDFVVIPSEVTITSESTAITGEFTVTYADGEWTLTAPAADNSNKTLTISNPNWESVMYVPLPAGTHKLTIEGKTFTKAMTHAVTMQKGVFYPIKCAHAFSVSSSRKVYFSPGNFQYYNTSNYGTPVAGIGWNGDNGNMYWDDNNTCARFAPNQWDRQLSNNRQEQTRLLVTYARPATNTWIDLFGWGTGTIPGYNIADASATGSEIAYDEWDDWGQYYGDRANSVSHCTGSWFTMSSNQWSYLLNITSNTIRNGKCRIGSVNGVPGLIIAPDDYSGSIPASINASTWTSNYQKHGLVFLPSGGHMDYMANVNYSWGFRSDFGGYWTSTPETGETISYRKAYLVELPEGASGNPSITERSMCRTALNNGNRPGKLCVRLVQYAN